MTSPRTSTLNTMDAFQSVSRPQILKKHKKKKKKEKKKRKRETNLNFGAGCRTGPHKDAHSLGLGFHDRPSLAKKKKYTKTSQSRATRVANNEMIQKTASMANTNARNSGHGAKTKAATPPAEASTKRWATVSTGGGGAEKRTVG